MGGEDNLEHADVPIVEFDLPFIEVGVEQLNKDSSNHVHIGEDEEADSEDVPLHDLLSNDLADAGPTQFAARVDYRNDIHCDEEYNSEFQTPHGVVMYQ